MTPDGQLELGGAAAATTFVCAAYDYDLEVAEPLFTLLPSVLHVPADPVTGREIAVLVDLLAGEAGARKPGARSAAARLIDLLLIASIRHWTRLQPPDSDPSWLKGLRDPTLAKALALLHERPGEGWTLESLAKQVHLSRATLARRFTQSVGEPPLAYLARWRMHLASQRLKYTTDAIQMIAPDVGYSSVYAFNRAFSLYRGQPPGRYRRTAQAA